jgi:Na+/serine symporter
MQSFDTTLMNLYLIGAFAIAALAVVLSAAVVTTEVVRHRHSRTAPAPSKHPLHRPVPES